MSDFEYKYENDKSSEIYIQLSKCIITTLEYASC